MKNNDGKGLYEIGEQHRLECGCVVVAEEIGYTHYVHSECGLDKGYHAQIKGYRFTPMVEG